MIRTIHCEFWEDKIGVILSLAATASTLNMELTTIGGSIAVGAIISGLLVSILGMFGLANLLKKWFTPVVMFVFLLLLANQLIYIFLKGMLGLNNSEYIDVYMACFSFMIAAFTIYLNVKGKGVISNLSLLIGMVDGWIGTVSLFQHETVSTVKTTPFLTCFSWGELSLAWGIVLIVVITGL